MSCIFNAICLALIDAGVALKDFMVAVNSAFLKGQCLLDLNYQEEVRSRGMLIISYLPKSNEISFMELSKSKISKKDFKEVMDLALEGCKKVYEIFKKGIYDSVKKQI